MRWSCSNYLLIIPVISEQREERGEQTASADLIAWTLLYLSDGLGRFIMYLLYDLSDFISQLALERAEFARKEEIKRVASARSTCYWRGWDLHREL